MKIGIIVYSATGNTYSVANQLHEKLAMLGHDVTIDRILIKNITQPGKNIDFDNIPDTKEYTSIIFASPVEAFTLNKVMQEYLTQISSLDGKKISCFVTQHFPYPWMGGNQAIARIKKLCKAKGATIDKIGIVNWTNKRRKQMIADVVERLSTLSL